MNRIVFGIITAFTSIVFALLIIEVVLRVLDLGYGSLPIESDPVLHHAHPKNYEYVMHDPNGEFGGHKVYFDNQGLVANPKNANSPCKHLKYNDAQYRIAFMGDSFTESIQVAYEDTFVGLLESYSNGTSIVKNYGITSYSPILYLVQWREKVSKFNPTHVVLQLYSNDIPDDIEWGKYAVYSDDGRLVAVAGEGGEYKNSSDIPML